MLVQRLLSGNSSRPELRVRGVLKTTNRVVALVLLNPKVIVLVSNKRTYGLSSKTTNYLCGSETSFWGIGLGVV